MSDEGNDRGGAIFVNYRRVDDPFFARTLYERLTAAFPDRTVFFDVDSIPPGQSFRQVLTRALDDSDVLLAVVGSRWLEATDEHGQRRLDNPEDWVRLELETARELGRRVIPVLAGGAPPPRARALPPSLAWFAECNALRVTTERFDSDIAGLIRKVRQALTEEAAGRRRREQARRAAEEAQKAAGGGRLDPAHIRRVEALADWDFIKDRDEPEALREHIERFAGVETVRLATKRLQDLEWRALRSSSDVEALRRFVAAYPKGRHAKQAQARLERLERPSTLERLAGPASGSPAVGYGVGLLVLVVGGLGVATLITVGANDEGGAPREAAAIVEPESPQPEAVATKQSKAGTLVYVPGGTFQMGSPSSEPGRSDNEGPVHSVTVSGLWVMKTEVSQGLYADIVGSNPSRFSSCGRRCPVEWVSWKDAVEFANRLSEADGLTPAYRISGERVSWNREASGYRLLTEAEWEYAARGGESYRFAGSNDATEVGWIGDNANGTTHPSCGRQENGFGLCDMTGNVWEWVWDWYGSYSSGAQQNPSGPTSGTLRVFRGGSWNSSSRRSRVADRYDYSPGNRNVSLGFRLARPAP